MTGTSWQVGDEVIMKGLAGNVRVRIVEMEGRSVKVHPLEDVYFELEDGVATYADVVWTDTSLLTRRA
jgi:hypothetical protein